MSRQRRILTPEHVPIVLVPAGVGSRFLALIVDFILLTGLIALLAAVLQLVLPRGIGAE